MIQDKVFLLVYLICAFKIITQEQNTKNNKKNSNNRLRIIYILLQGKILERLYKPLENRCSVDRSNNLISLRVQVHANSCYLLKNTALNNHLSKNISFSSSKNNDEDQNVPYFIYLINSWYNWSKISSNLHFSISILLHLPCLLIFCLCSNK